MSKLSKLPVEGRRACTALGNATQWSAEEWARSVWHLDDAGIFPAVGLTHIYEISTKTGIAPLEAAQALSSAAKAETMRQANELITAIPPPTPAELGAGVDLTPFLELSPGGRAVLVSDTPHEKAEVCTATGRAFAGSPHLHRCERLEGHSDALIGRAHRCSSCKAIW